jgi:predicted SAM-dependent methyltransferase
MQHHPLNLTADQSAKTVLNIGCGQFPLADALNVDILPQSKADILLDLNEPHALLRLPREHYETIAAFHILEHVDDVFGVIADCAILLKPGGILHIRVPHFSRGFTNAEHRHGFDVGFPAYFNHALREFYYGPSLELVRMRMDWAIRFDLYQLVIHGWQVAVLKTLNAIITPLANLSPGFCSRIWCFWVGGFEQIEFVYRKPSE